MTEQEIYDRLVALAKEDPLASTALRMYDEGCSLAEALAALAVVFFVELKWRRENELRKLLREEAPPMVVHKDQFDPEEWQRLMATAKPIPIAVEPNEPSAETLQRALEESVKLQSHYAGLLNKHDGGRRRQFGSAGAWLDRAGPAGGHSRRAAAKHH